MAEIVAPTIEAMRQEGAPYLGVLYVGLMITREGPRVVEFNCRFGDPECQVILPRLDQDLLPVLEAVAEGERLASGLAWRAEASVCVVLASRGYPGAYETGYPICGVAEAARLPDRTSSTPARRCAMASSSRRAGACSVSRRSARTSPTRSRAPTRRSGGSRFEGVHCRNDIGRRAIGPVTRMLAMPRERSRRQRSTDAAAILRDGGLVAFPTESFYGLGADALDPYALARVFSVKGRPESKPLLVLVDAVATAEALVAEVSAGARDLMARHWPGPLTLVLKAAPRLPPALTAGTDTVGVRMPGHPIALGLVRAAGFPVTAPSANPSGQPPPLPRSRCASTSRGRWT